MNPTRFELLVGAEAFWSRAAQDIAAAKARVLVQAMTLEGDAAGAAVADALTAATARERRLLVDAYSFHVTNDTLFPSLPWQPAELRAEAKATRSLLSEIAIAGVDVAITNPVGRSPLHFPLRNHKKVVVADDIAYLGGINFSDHNFAWHDCMVRIADAGAAEFLAEAFTADRGGAPQLATAQFDGLELISLVGLGNEAALAPVIELFANARHSVEMIGAYPTLPFTDALAQAAARGCAVTIYTPDANNKPLLRDFLFAVASGANAPRLALLPEMTHAKTALVDGDTVLFGSVNFNLASWRSNSDFLAISRDPALVAAFEQALFAPARAAAVPARLDAVPEWRKVRAKAALRAGDALLGRLRSYKRMRRVVEWASLAPPYPAHPERSRGT